MEDYRVIEFLLKEEDKIKGDLNLISIVQSPATELNFQLFSSVKQPLKRREYKFNEVNEKRILTGCFMRPNLNILRLDVEGNPYYCWFSEDTIRDCAQLFMKKSNNHKTNLEHSNYEISKGVYVFESWIETDP